MLVISLPSKYGPIQKSFCRLDFSIDPDDNDDGAPAAAAADVIAAATPADPVPAADDDDAVKADNDDCDVKDDDNAIDWTISAFMMPSERNRQQKRKNGKALDMFRYYFIGEDIGRRKWARLDK